MKSDKYDLITVLGPTAGGKTAFAAHLCDAIGGEIISADSRQVYRHMNIGTGKDYNDYNVSGRIIPCHLIDIVEPGYRYNIFEYRNDFLKAYRNIVSKNKMPVLCGGSGLYLNAVTGNYFLPEVKPDISLRKQLGEKTLEELTAMLAPMKKLHNKTDTDTKEHAVRAIEIAMNSGEQPSAGGYPVNILYLGIRFERQEERARITERLNRRIEQGLVEEVKALLERGISAADLMYYGLEYRFITLYLTGNISYDEMTGKLNTAIHQFAKRQMTWFRKMEKEGTVIHWIDGNLAMEEKVRKALELTSAPTYRKS
jgi:tRNA dimethylallyltransferase